MNVINVSYHLIDKIRFKTQIQLAPDASEGERGRGRDHTTQTAQHSSRGGSRVGLDWIDGFERWLFSSSIMILPTVEPSSETQEVASGSGGQRWRQHIELRCFPSLAFPLLFHSFFSTSMFWTIFTFSSRPYAFPSQSLKMSSFSLRGSQLSPLSSQFKPTRLSSTSNLQFQLRSIRSTTSNSSIHLRQLPSTSFSPVSTPILIPRNLSRVSPFNFSRFESTASTGLSRSKATSSNPTAISSESSTENQNSGPEPEPDSDEPPRSESQMVKMEEKFQKLYRRSSNDLKLEVYLLLLRRWLLWATSLTGAERLVDERPLNGFFTLVFAYSPERQSADRFPSWMFCKAQFQVPDVLDFGVGWTLGVHL